MKNTFVDAIHTKHKLRVTFFSKKDGKNLVRTCAPTDYGPRRNWSDKSDRFHFWDYDSLEKSHTLSLLPDQVVTIEHLDETFNPAEFITWDTKQRPWFVKRDWGAYS